VSADARAGAARPAIAPGFRLQWEAAQDAWVLLFPEGLIRLNASAGEILKRCDGAATIEQIIADLERAFGAADLAADVRHFLAVAREKRWVEFGG
jgi:pyrroloquinoline quinone biosynthesis protein D